MKGIVTKKQANFFLVADDKLNIYEAQIRGKLKLGTNVLVGDKVELSEFEGQYMIEKILDRQNNLIRPLVANVDALVLVMSAKEPKFSLKELNIYLAFFESQQIDDVYIFISKTDLLSKSEKKELDELVQEYEKDQYKFYSHETKSFDEFLKIFTDNKLICLAGQSGVGKSTLVNKMMPELKIATQEISFALNRGKHTTTNVSLNRFKDAYVVDTPGFSRIDVRFKKKQFAQAYSYYRKLGAQCHFSNCLHQSEKNCNVLQHYNSNQLCKYKYLDYLELLKKCSD